MSQLHEQAALGTGIDEKAEARADAASDVLREFAYAGVDAMREQVEKLTTALQSLEKSVGTEWHDDPAFNGYDLTGAERAGLQSAYAAAWAAVCAVEDAKQHLQRAIGRLREVV